MDYDVPERSTTQASRYSHHIIRSVTWMMIFQKVAQHELHAIHTIFMERYVDDTPEQGLLYNARCNLWSTTSMILKIVQENKQNH